MNTANLTSALLASMLAVGCAPIGGDSGGRRTNTVDAGTTTTDQTCDTTNIPAKSMDITFTASAALASLPTGCWKLDGTLTVDSTVTSLAKLGDLRGVTNLVINGSQLTGIDTPSALAVTGSINIENNSKLTDLTNLSITVPDATCVSGTGFLTSVSVTGNSLITSLGAVSSVACVSGATTITNNAALQMLDLSSAVRLEGGLTVSNNAALTSMDLSALDSITGGLTVKGNALLTDLGSWSALSFVHGALTIDSNAALQTLLGVMPATTKSIMIEGALTITNNPLLTALGEFDHLSWAQSINISSNAKLDYCEAREVGCCVADSNPQNVNTAEIGPGNKNSSCGGASSWCYGADGNKCRNDYTGYTGSL